MSWAESRLKTYLSGSVLLLCCSLVLTVSLAAQVVVTNSGYATNAGPGVQVAPASSPLMTAPQITFVNSSNAPVGATNGTGSNMVGATNSTVGSVPGISNASTTIPVYLSNQATTQPTQTAISPGGTPQLQPGAEEENIPGVFRTGAAVQTDSANAAFGETANIAQIARESRARTQLAANVRNYTNDDIQHVQARTGVSKPAGFTFATAVPNGGGVSGAAALNRNLGAEETATEVPAAPASAPTANTATGTATETAPQNQPPAATNGTSPNSAAQAGTVQNPNSPTPSNEQAQPARLPGTSSYLPLLMLVGSLAGGTGVVLRFVRRARTH